MIATLAAPLKYTSQVGLVPHAHTPAEHIIDWATDSVVHHAILGITEEICISLEPQGAVLRYISRFPDAIWSRWNHTPKQQADILQFGHDHIDAKYGWLQDLAIGIAHLSNEKTPQFIQNYLSSDKTYECAQFCDAALTYAGIHLFKDVVPAAVYPGMFYDVYKELGWV